MSDDLVKEVAELRKKLCVAESECERLRKNLEAVSDSFGIFGTCATVEEMTAEVERLTKAMNEANESDVRAYELAKNEAAEVLENKGYKIVPGPTFAVALLRTFDAAMEQTRMEYEVEPMSRQQFRRRRWRSGNNSG